MISPEKEIVPFYKKIDVNEGDKKGNVEKWLLEIENQMKATLRQISKESNTDLTERNLWVQKYPAMVVLAINMIRWTFNVEQSIKSLEHSPNSVFDLQETLN
jgi:dynein heavy chain